MLILRTDTRLRLVVHLERNDSANISEVGILRAGRSTGVNGYIPTARPRLTKTNQMWLICAAGKVRGRQLLADQIDWRGLFVEDFPTCLVVQISTHYMVS